MSVSAVSFFFCIDSMFAFSGIAHACVGPTKITFQDAFGEHPISDIVSTTANGVPQKLFAIWLFFVKVTSPSARQFQHPVLRLVFHWPVYPAAISALQQFDK